MKDGRGRGSKTGFKGVSYRKELNKYAARIYLRGDPVHLGMFDTPEAAHMAYLEARQKYAKELA